MEYDDAPSVIFTIGISGSGKTTWAERYCAENLFYNVNRDDIREQLFGSDYVFDYKKERIVTGHQQAIIDSLVEDRSDFVISDTNLNNKHYMKHHAYLESKGYEIFIKVFDVDVEECIRRDLARDRTVGEDVIRRQYATFTEIDFLGRLT